MTTFQCALIVITLVAAPGRLAAQSIVPRTEPLPAAELKRFLEQLPDGTRHQATMAPLRDNVRLMTDIFLPPDGDGPWPVLLLRTPYNRFNPRPTPRELTAKPCAIVVQNQRGLYGSEGALPKDSFANEVDDGYDAVEWCAKQPWCDGRVVMWGASGHGIAPTNAVWSRAPHLVAVHATKTGDDAYLHWCFSGGARRAMYNWMAARNQQPGSWPRPTTISYDLSARHAFIAERAKENPVYFIANAGWYDLFGEAALDTFAALAPNGRSFVVMGPVGHAKLGGDLQYPTRGYPPGVAVPTIDQVLSGDALPHGSQLVYYLMGDTKDPAAPGNEWRVTGSWPAPHTPTDFFLGADAALSLSRPTADVASLTYSYDPRQPAPTFGGNGLYTSGVGPQDQRPLSQRADVLRFVTQPLAEPLGMTGKVWVELDFTSDVSDTMFVAKLVDIYPDGYEALLRESAGLARYHGGLNAPRAIEPGRHYTLRLDLWSTAQVFAKEHRIGLYITSSSSGAYEVHPNDYAPVSSLDAAPIASNTIHCSATHASRLILPLIAPDMYLKRDAR